ncbi:MAG TPA: GNAT family protein [Puia sp.]|nr:GNAT family protein [Puia sp.]
MSVALNPPIIRPDQLSLLRGRFVYLDFARESDREVLRPLARDERIWEFTKTLLITDTYDEQFDAYFDAALGTVSEGQAFVIRRIPHGEVLGMTRIHSATYKDKWAEIGHTWYLPEIWGQVYNKECKLLLLQYLFETVGLLRVQFRIAHQNIRSMRAVEKIGGVLEGVLRKHAIRNDGSRRDTVVYSIIDDEWPEKKRRLLHLVETEPAGQPATAS